MRISSATYKPISYSIGNSQNSKFKNTTGYWHVNWINSFLPLTWSQMVSLPRKSPVSSVYGSLLAKTKLTSKENHYHRPFLIWHPTNIFLFQQYYSKRLLYINRPWYITRHGCREYIVTRFDKKTQRKFKSPESNLQLIELARLCLLN